MNLLGVGPTTIKRWADEGRLPFYRTAGGHRRFRESAVRRLASSTDSQEAWVPQSATWLEWLMERDLSFVVSKLQELPQTHGDWFGAADFLGNVTRLIGKSWAEGDCTVIEEHIASMKLSQGLSAVSAAHAVRRSRTVCLLATLAGERHGIGARLAQTCLRSVDLNAIMLGTDVKSNQLEVHLRRQKPTLLALSASVWQTDAATLEREADRLGVVCEHTGTELVLGGFGAWPDAPSYGHRCHNFVELRDIANRIVPN